MTVYQNTFEGGTDSTAVTTANSGGASGDAFNAATAGISYSTTRAHEGTHSGMFTTDAATTYLAWYPGANTNFAARAYYYFTEANSGGEFHLTGLYEAGGNSALIFRLTSGNVLRVYKNIAPTSNSWAPTTTMPVGSWIRTELLVEQGTTSSNGRVRAAIFSGNSTTPLAESGWVTGLNLGAGTNTLAHVRFGKMVTGSNADGVFVDDIVLKTGADYTGTWIGPSTLPPSAAPGYRWNGSSYVPLEFRRWNGSSYVVLDRNVI